MNQKNRIDPNAHAILNPNDKEMKGFGLSQLGFYALLSEICVIVDLEMSSNNRAEKEESSEPPSLITSLPDDVIVDILARVPTCDYPTLSLVSKQFRSLVALPKLYARRSLLGCTELYVLLYNVETRDDRWYILGRKANGNRRLVLIRSLPAMPCDGRYVVVGSRIYVFGGRKSSSALSIDCRSHTVHPLPSIPIAMDGKVAGIIDGKIYIIGDSVIINSYVKVMVVFNTETQMWEPGMIKQCKELGHILPAGCVVMADKMYARNFDNSFVYEPKESKWERDEMLSLKSWLHACVVDDVLYYHERYENELRAYDPTQRCWGVVKRLEVISAEMRCSAWSQCELRWETGFVFS